MSKQPLKLLHASSSDLSPLMDKLKEMTGSTAFIGFTLDVDLHKNDGFVVLSVKTLIDREYFKTLELETFVSKYHLSEIQPK
jgi:hypothetical protein